MSIAMERLAAADRRLIAEAILTEPKPFKQTSIGAHCPFHAEQTPGGAFYYDFEIDQAYCHSCKASHDLVGVFNAVHGRDPADPGGCSEFVERYCDPSAPIKRQPKRPAKLGWRPGEVTLPPALWMEKAAAFVEHSVERLQAKPERLAELEQWGIDADTARLCRFGWNDRDKYPPVTAWGLPHELNTNKTGEAKVWLPEGLVMPAVHSGQVVKVKIRRPRLELPWDPTQLRKYWEVKGGANHLFHVYGNPAFKVWVVIETERDAALVWRHVHDLGIGAIGTGGATKRPGGYVADILGRAKLVLNGLDYDRAGSQESYAFWDKEYPIAKRWPAPPSMGKDVGDAIGAGLDVREWVLEGLPTYIKRELGLLGQPSPNETPEAEAETVPAPPVKIWFEQVLEMMENMPLWRDELVEFRGELQEARFKLFMGANGRPWVGVREGVDLSDETTRQRLWVLRERFHSMRVMDEWMSANNLEDIVATYFSGKLEVKG